MHPFIFLYFFNCLSLYFSVTIAIKINNALVRLVDLDETTVVSPDDINFPRSVPKKWTNNAFLDKLTFSVGATYKVTAIIPSFGNYVKSGIFFSHYVTNFAYGITLGTMNALFKRGKYLNVLIDEQIT